MIGSRGIRYFKKMRFKQKLYLSYLIAIIIPILVVGLYSYGQARLLLLQQAKQGLSDSIRHIAENVNYKINRYGAVLSYITLNPQVNQVINNTDVSYFENYINWVGELDPLMNGILNLNDDIENIIIYSSNTNVLERTNSIQRMDRISDKIWFPAAIKDNRQHWAVEGKSLIGLNRFMEFEKGATQNLLYVQLKYDRIFQEVSTDKMKQK